MNIGKHRTKRRLISFLPRKRKCSHGAPVKGLFHGDNFAAIGMAPIIKVFFSDFDSALDCFRTRVGKKYLLHIGSLVEQLGRFNCRNIVKQIGSVQQFFNLFMQHTGILRAVVS